MSLLCTALVNHLISKMNDPEENKQTNINLIEMNRTIDNLPFNWKTRKRLHSSIRLKNSNYNPTVHTLTLKVHSCIVCKSGVLDTCY